MSKIPRNQIIEGDAESVLSTFVPQFVDFTIADFPYFISGVKSNLTKKGSKLVQADFGKWDQVWKGVDEYLDWVFLIFTHLKHVGKPNSSVIAFLDHKIAGWVGHELERKGMFVYKSPIIWVKNNPIPHIRKTGFRSSFEHAIWLINSDESYFGSPKSVVKPSVFNFLRQEDMMNVWRYNIGQKATSHPTEKPLDLTTRLVSIFSNEGDLVLDPFLGSGTSAVAARDLKRAFLGIELSPEYVEMATKRLQKRAFPLV